MAALATVGVVMFALHLLADVPTTVAPRDTTIAPSVEVRALIGDRYLDVAVLGLVNPTTGCDGRVVTDLRVVGYPGGIGIDLPYQVPRAMDGNSAFSVSGPAPPPEVTTIEVSGLYECMADFTTSHPRTPFRQRIVLRDGGAP